MQMTTLIPHITSDTHQYIFVVYTVTHMVCHTNIAELHKIMIKVLKHSGHH